MNTVCVYPHRCMRTQEHTLTQNQQKHTHFNEVVKRGLDQKHHNNVPRFIVLCSK